MVAALAGSVNRRGLAINAAGSRNRLEQNTTVSEMHYATKSIKLHYQDNNRL